MIKAYFKIRILNIQINDLLIVSDLLFLILQYMLFIKMPEMMKMSTHIAVFSSVNIALGVVSISIQVLHFLKHLKIN